MFKKDVKLTIKTKIFDGENDHEVEVNVFGTLAFRDNNYFFKYVEMTEIGDVYNLIKFDGEKVSVMRKGAINVKQNFVIGEENCTVLQMQLGEIFVTAKTISINFQEKGIGSVEL